MGNASHYRSGITRGLLSVPQAITLAHVREWSEEAERGLGDALQPKPDMIRDGVKSGRMELWRVNGDSWLVTEFVGEALMIWCYAGYDFRSMFTAMVKAAKANGIKTVQFFTRHRAVLRGLRAFKLKPENEEGCPETLWTVTI